MGILISATELAAELSEPRHLIVLASLWNRVENSGQADFISGHIPTALLCEAAEALGQTPSEDKGRNPMPNPDILQRWVNGWGIKPESNIVVYDEARGLYAARAWFVLRWAGIENVRILDGNFEAWKKANQTIAIGPGSYTPRTDFPLKFNQMRIADIEQVKAHSGLLLDVRSPRRFKGEREILDLRAGRIPGAINLPTSELFNEDQTFKAPAELKEIFTAAGVVDPTEVIVYSGSGLHSSQALLAMELAGLPGAANYVGGWSQWAADKANPIMAG